MPRLQAAAHLTDIKPTAVVMHSATQGPTSLISQAVNNIVGVAFCH